MTDTFFASSIIVVSSSAICSFNSSKRVWRVDNSVTIVFFSSFNFSIPSAGSPQLWNKETDKIVRITDILFHYN